MTDEGPIVYTDADAGTDTLVYTTGEADDITGYDAEGTDWEGWEEG